MSSALYRYREVANRIASMIGEGTFLPGARIPSVRVLSGQLRVSPATVFQAYGELEERGLIAARPQSGFYVKEPTPLAPPPSAGKVSTRAAPVSTTELTLSIIAS